MPSLTKKTDTLGYSNAYHLLRRTTYNITKARIMDFATKTPEEALNILFTFTNPVPPGPLNINKETVVPTFANPTVTDTLNSSSTENFDTMWWLYQAMKDTSAQYRITCFLHVLFITDDDSAFWINYDYKELLRFHASGSLKDLAIRMTLNPRMLAYLNNNLNTKTSPDQNYAREFLELFTILKGPQIGPGNYTNYTETDVQQAARVLTGFTYTGAVFDRFARLNNIDPITKIPKGSINVAKHDTGNKTFSSAFGNTVITGGSTEADIQAEFESFVTMVFNQDETAKAYCRRMYRFFVGRNITSEIETDIIVPLAAMLKSNGYMILPVLRELLTSKHFYDEEDGVHGDQTIGSLIKSPIELFFHVYSLLDLQTPLYADNPLSLYHFFVNTHNFFINCGMPLFKPQSVNGFAGYSSSPNYDKNWVTTSSLRIRYIYAIDQIIGGLTIDGVLYKLDLPAFVKNNPTYFPAPSNADTVVTNFLELLHIEVATGARYTDFRTIFLGGLSTTSWANAWNTYATTGNTDSVKTPLNNLVRALIKSPEFQIL